MSTIDVLTRARQPEYTGENRCIPCTVANLGIAVCGSVGLTIILGRWTALALGLSAAVGTAAFLVSCLLIYLRGYLIPGTPTLTKRYFPDWLLRRFDKAPGQEGQLLEDVDVETLLRDAEILEEQPDGEDLRLEPAFERQLWTRIDMLQQKGIDPDLTVFMNDTERAALNSEDVTIQQYDEAFAARVDGQLVAQWTSEAAYIADRAAAHVCQQYVPEWDRLGFAARTELLGAIRLYLTACPTCDRQVTPEHETVESCCREVDVVAISCDGCDSRLLEIELDPATAEAAL